ncbi:MAG: hypothetical protein FJZ96_10545 [Chloroflexi bacterium]|nr:hypothetical protein [Chloroflexota bacterium]
MTRRDYLLLALLGLVTAIIVAKFEPSPGYMDADYYAATSLELASGRGFSEPFLWNYLDDPAGLPHPSHAYWMPLASLLAAIFPTLTGEWNWPAARLPFILLTACLPLLVASLSFSISSRRDLALVSGLLAIFSGYYLPYLVTTDTFILYMFLGGAWFLLLARQVTPATLLLYGLTAGLMHLARADGIFWLLLSLCVVAVRQFRERAVLPVLARLGLTLTGYLLPMLPWFIRNLATFGTALAPGGSMALWLTDYDRLFAYPATQVDLATWVQAGWQAALHARVWALGINLGNALVVQGAVFLFPFILVGAWQYRRERIVLSGGIAWLVTLLAMTVAFPFAGARGGFFHSGSALQPLWWALAPAGIASAVSWISRKRNWLEVRARRIFLGGAVGLSLFVTVFFLAIRLPDWGRRFEDYRRVDQLIDNSVGEAPGVIMVANPPGYYLATGRQAIVIPDGDEQALLAVADRYGAGALALEAGRLVSGLQDLYDDPVGQPGLAYLGQVEGTLVFIIQP